MIVVWILVMFTNGSWSEMGHYRSKSDCEQWARQWTGQGSPAVCRKSSIPAPPPETK
jgi:hypothetical protein